jgi:hypothetical protein
VALRLGGAPIWRPAPPPAVAVIEQLRANVRFAASVLEHRRHTCSSVIDREAAASLAALEDACRRLDSGRAAAEIHRLVGWGEGLTPAGDDALVGMLAALGFLARAEADKHSFLRSLSAAILVRLSRTTSISGHYLRLAAQGHFNADVTGLANALVGGRDGEGQVGVAEALDAALDVGATSGADMVAGMIAGFRAWAMER